jgi:hypothetical protein
MKQGTTFGGDQQFSYTFQGGVGAQIHFSEDGCAFLPRGFLRPLRKRLAGKSVAVGISNGGDQSEESLGAILHEVGFQWYLAAHLAAVLIAEGMADPDGADRVIFREFS